MALPSFICLCVPVKHSNLARLRVLVTCILVLECRHKFFYLPAQPLFALPRRGRRAGAARVESRTTSLIRRPKLLT